MERKKRSKGRGWESCYVKKITGRLVSKLVKFCKHVRVSFSSIDIHDITYKYRYIYLYHITTF